MSRVLLVESDLTTSHAISRTLSALGFGVDVAYDAQEADEFVRHQSYRFSLIDQRLSDMDGIQAFARLHAVQQDLDGILLSSSANLNLVATAVDAGMTRVLVKPVDYGDLLAVLNRETDNRENRAVTSDALLDEVVSEKSIAEVSDDAIHTGLSDSQLIDIIRSVEYPFAGKDRLEFFDRDTLERVVHLIRRWCRHRRQQAAW